MTPGVSQSNDSLRGVRITNRGSKIAAPRYCSAHSSPGATVPTCTTFMRKSNPGAAAGKANIAVAGKLLNTVFYTLKNDWVFEDFSNFIIKPCNRS